MTCIKTLLSSSAEISKHMRKATALKKFHPIAMAIQKLKRNQISLTEFTPMNINVIFIFFNRT